MEEQYLQRLYDWVITQDPTFKDDFSYYDFAYNMQNNESYAGRMYNWIGSIDNTFKADINKTEFKEKVASSELGMLDLIQDTQQNSLEEAQQQEEQQAQQQAQQQEEQPVVEEPKKKGFIQETIDEAIATASASTSEEQPSSSDSQETDDLSSFEQSISETSLESLERYRGDLEASTILNDVGLAKLEIVNKEIARREEEKAREGETETERSARLQREIEANLNITPQQQQADEAFVPTPEGVATQDRGTAFTPTIQTPSEDVSQETADIEARRRAAETEGEIEQYKVNQQEARKMNESEGIENFQVETIESDAGPQYDFGSKTFVETKDKTYLAYPEGMTLEQAREEGKVMEFTTEEQAKYFAKGGWKDKETSANFDKVGRWMEEKIDWFFEDDDDWLDNEDLDDEPFQESLNNTKRPLTAISLRAPKALPPQIEGRRNNSDKLDEWPDDQSFKLNKWERKDNLIKQNASGSNDSCLDERTPQRRKNIPRSSRRKY